MKRLICMTLIAVFVALSDGAADGLAPVRRPLREPLEHSPVCLTNSIGMKFVWIPPGSFMMGSPKEEAKRQKDEAQHQVTLTRGFCMGVYAVTQKQWKEIIGTESQPIHGGEEPAGRYRFLGRLPGVHQQAARKGR